MISQSVEKDQFNSSGRLEKLQSTLKFFEGRKGAWLVSRHRDVEIRLPDESAEGQLARGITGGRTLSNNRGKPPPMLGFRCGIEALDEARDGSVGSCASCFSNLANSSSSCAISRR